MATDVCQNALARMYGRLEQTAAEAEDGFPHFCEPAGGRWSRSPQADWTGGFWVGMLWVAAACGLFGDPCNWRKLAHRWMYLLAPRLESDTVFRGFLFYYGAALGDLLEGDAEAREVGLAAARALAGSFNPAARLMPLGKAAEEAADVGVGEANIDSVQASALLAWAAEHAGEPRLREIASAHARRHIELCLRADGSVCQSASFDPATGLLVRRYTHKGFSDRSTWARAQAWGMIGWTMAFARLGESELLNAAEAAADWWCAHLPADRVAFWDFDDPAIPNTNRDTSATAIAAAAMLKLGRLSGRPRARRYEHTARTMIDALLERHLQPQGALGGGCYNRRIELAADAELIWGSYYLFESLHVLCGLLDPLLV